MSSMRLVLIPVLSLFAAVLLFAQQDNRPVGVIVTRTVEQSNAVLRKPCRAAHRTGAITLINSIDIFWPTSKTHQLFENVAVGQYLQIKEFASIYLKQDRPPILPSSHHVAENR
jgi:hypothetical protein